jgi:phosphohistidine phosphatase
MGAWPVVRCYLVRHGDALSAQVDAERPLSQRGRKEVAALGQLALNRNVQVAEICHSGIRRAGETAEILASYLKPSRGVRQIAGLLPEDDPALGKAELESIDEPVMWVGHLPYMNRLGALLVTDAAAVEFTPAAMLCCNKIDTRWQIEWRLAPALA